MATDWELVTEIFLKFQNVWELVRQLVHSPFGDNDLVPFHLKQIKFVLKCKNVYECFAQDCSLIKMSFSDLIVFCGFCMWFYNSRASGWDNYGKILIYRGNLSFYILGKYLNFHFTKKYWIFDIFISRTWENLLTIVTDILSSCLLFYYLKFWFFSGLRQKVSKGNFFLNEEFFFLEISGCFWYFSIAVMQFLHQYHKACYHLCQYLTCWWYGWN